MNGDKVTPAARSGSCLVVRLSPDRQARDRVDGRARLRSRLGQSARGPSSLARSRQSGRAGPKPGPRLPRVSGSETKPSRSTKPTRLINSLSCWYRFPVLSIFPVRLQQSRNPTPTLKVNLRRHESVDRAPRGSSQDARPTRVHLARVPGHARLGQVCQKSGNRDRCWKRKGNWVSQALGRDGGTV